ncbi:Uncharacterized protein DIS24_g7816 [Lasiodiplodia hormozganensis]|uniref:Uncharacterized protein n=1 Tax=Lasiodiplodia hormozganensis TaxID=869390 RepID=A0AA40CQ97_9PEZI|nr:Uncharacterized protein DIS24_g7816 [Lasiodiplodia hormozganensis]
MEVDKTAFWGRLLEIIEAVSTAHFVAFDLELSGIPSKGTSGTKQTLEERYNEIKDAADRYQILQIGLTCVEQDLQSERYVVRPYNFNLSPLLEERLDIERIWSFQSGAAEFLLSVGFKMDLPMTKGVPYLSREEAKETMKLTHKRWDKSTIADVQLKEDEVQSLEFVNKVRTAIDTWKETGKPFPDLLNIVSTNPVGVQPTYPELGNFEKRLVHQLVRAEYPDLITVSKPQSIQIKPFDEEREKGFLKRRKNNLDRQIERQTGFRWIIEALCGGELNINPELFARDVDTGAAKSANMMHLKARFDRARLTLQRRRPVLVGHNLFTDILYLYRTFIGPLPLTLEKCRGKLHKLFPLVVDTKYVATHNCGDINPRSSLEEIHHKLRDQDKPTIGYDSFLTALIMIRLSTKLEHDGAYLKDVSLADSDDDEAYDTAEEILPDRSGSPPLSTPNQGMITLDGVTELLTPAITPGVDGDQTALMQEVAPLADTDTAQKKASRKKKKKKGGQTNTNTKSSSMFSSKNKFEQLAIADTESEGEMADVESEKEEDAEATSESLQNDLLSKRPEKSQVEAVQWGGTTYYSYENEGAAPQSSTVNREATEPMTLMPPFETDFWRVYGNKLRVFGTTESVWKLRP